MLQWKLILGILHYTLMIQEDYFLVGTVTCLTCLMYHAKSTINFNLLNQVMKLLFLLDKLLVLEVARSHSHDSPDRPLILF